MYSTMKTALTLRQMVGCGVMQRRTLFGMLNAVFNRPDNNRIKEVGVERACAEWLLRCGARVRWKDSNKFHIDYNSLPPEQLHKYVIEEIDADDAAIMQLGFPHFAGCNHIKKVRFKQCMYIDDMALSSLEILKNSLEHLEIGDCGNVTDKGLTALPALSLLKTLVLYDLPEVRNASSCYTRLKTALPDCEIMYKNIG